jgi:hypothetical protein
LALVEHARLVSHGLSNCRPDRIATIATISLSSGNAFSMTTTGALNPTTDFYVQSLKVNGKACTQSWLTWNDVFANGGTMEFVLGGDFGDGHGVLGFLAVLG